MRVAIVGSHGVGKTSLLSKLQNKVEFENYDFYNEAVREISYKGFPYNEKTEDCSQLAMLALNLLRFRSNDFFTDRCILDVYVYSEVLKNRGSNISSFCIDILRHYWQQYKNAIDLYVFCPPEWDIIEDGVRMTDDYVRDMISTLMLAQLYMDLDSEKFLIVHGTTEDRCEQVISYMKVLGGLK